MPGSKKNTNKEADLATQIAAGIQKHFSAVAQLTVGGSTFTPAQLEAQLSALATLRSDVNAAKVVMEAKLSAERAKAPALREILLASVSFVRGTFGNSPEALADFGLKPKKDPRPLTAEQRVTQALKARATREARGTIGKRKKLAITGDVKGVVVTPITVAVHPSPSPAAPPAQGVTLNGATH